MLVLLLACVEDAPDRAGPAVKRNPDGPEPPGTTASEDPDGSAGSTPEEPTVFPTEQGEPISICINEFMPDTIVSNTDENGVASDWIELHNPTDTDLPLAGWSMSDDPNEPVKHRLSGELVLEAGGFLVLWADDQPDLGPTHLSFALSDEGEAVTLFDPFGNGSIVWYGPVGNDLSVARDFDCCTAEEGCFGYRFAGTPGGSNGDPNGGAPADTGQ